MRPESADVIDGEAGISVGNPAHNPTVLNCTMYMYMLYIQVGSTMYYVRMYICAVYK